MRPSRTREGEISSLFIYRGLHGSLWVSSGLESLLKKSNRPSVSSAAHMGETAGGWDAGMESIRGGFPGVHVSLPGTEECRSRFSASHVLTLLPDGSLAMLPGLARAISPSLHPRFLKKHCHMLYEL